LGFSKEKKEREKKQVFLTSSYYSFFFFVSSSVRLFLFLRVFLVIIFSLQLGSRYRCLPTEQLFTFTPGGRGQWPFLAFFIHFIFYISNLVFMSSSYLLHDGSDKFSSFLLFFMTLENSNYLRPVESSL
jgi:hypothetical protein